jgi:release factor glutamine methyltransferase
MNNAQKSWTVLSMLNWTSDYLAEKGFENARLNSERLLAHILKCRRVDLYLNFDRPLSVDELAKFKELLKRRLGHEPLQYVLGETEFYSLPFKVVPGVLIPRPETELLVEKALELSQFRHTADREPYILDIGTGSGNISIAIAKNLAQVRLLAIDESQDALAIAKENARINVVADRIEFRRLDILAEMPKEFAAAFDVIVSNPPYVSASEYEKLPPEIRQFEPKSALWAGEDGCDFYRCLAQIIRQWLKPGGFAIIEIGAGMAEEVSRIFRQAAFDEIQVFKDLAGRDRVIHVLSRK